MKVYFSNSLTFTQQRHMLCFLVGTLFEQTTGRQCGLGGLTHEQLPWEPRNAVAPPAASRRSVYSTFKSGRQE
ncbi:hypothetical protein I8748_09760 [Nostoc sp. CENA67]|uniref:Uncharacterized protein n=1 Tax=Amazonocrinis nigriterrae CENA67 TaxID=2794033 RepID=A0A8J7L8X4_9NOST|nr:hypothetical protein [Amazonocrinis nigriterrae]MBH8562456.1 hypothetical protein [Amazonocrinis nigriterrae CENA67]